MIGKQSHPALADDDPRDCVQEYPTCSRDSVELVAFDWEGVARYKAEIPRDEDIAGWHVLLLRRVRRKFPHGPHLER